MLDIQEGILKGYQGNDKELIIPNSVIKIDYRAFDGCSSLVKIVIPDSVTEIDMSAFEGCSSLQDLILPNSIKKIANGTFRGCTSLRSVIIPNSVLGIGNWAFEGCSSLQNVVIPDSVTYIMSFAFKDCTSLQTIEVPNSLSCIRNDVFVGCTSLQNVILSDSISGIGDDAFKDCSSLKKIFLPKSIEHVGSRVFENFDLVEVAKENKKICVKNNFIVNKKGTELLAIFGKEKNIVIPDGITKIKNIFNFSEWESVSIPASVKKIDFGPGFVKLPKDSIPVTVESFKGYRTLLSSWKARKDEAAKKAISFDENMPVSDYYKREFEGYNKIELSINDILGFLSEHKSEKWDIYIYNSSADIMQDAAFSIEDWLVKIAALNLPAESIIIRLPHKLNYFCDKDFGKKDIFPNCIKKIIIPPSFFQKIFYGDYSNYETELNAKLMRLFIVPSNYRCQCEYGKIARFIDAIMDNVEVYKTAHKHFPDGSYSLSFTGTASMFNIYEKGSSETIKNSVKNGDLGDKIIYGLNDAYFTVEENESGKKWEFSSSNGELRINGIVPVFKVISEEYDYSNYIAYECYGNSKLTVSSREGFNLGDITINKINMLSEKLSLFDAYFEVSDKKAKVDDYGDETFDYALFEGKKYSDSELGSL